MLRLKDEWELRALQQRLAGKPNAIESHPNKYHAKKVTVDGVTFASKAEAQRYAELKTLERMGKISSLRLQPEWAFTLNGVTVCTYRADFSYRDFSGTQCRDVVEDVKGFSTPVYRIKKKLLKAFYDIDVREVRKRRQRAKDKSYYERGV